jgi:hypothetical protein
VHLLALVLIYHPAGEVEVCCHHYLVAVVIRVVEVVVIRAAARM